MSMDRWQVGIDIGGTFTDVVALLPATGETRAAKVPTRRGDPVASILEALAAVRLEAGEVADLVHGTTLVTNAIVENRVEPVALIATAGFEDVLDIGRAARLHLYRLDLPPKLAAQVPPELRIGVVERLDHTGAVIVPLDSGSLAAAVEKLKTLGVESVAVSLLHAIRQCRSRAAGGRGRQAGGAVRLAFP